jgi:hypothetical protein
MTMDPDHDEPRGDDEGQTNAKVPRAGARGTLSVLRQRIT